MRLRWDIQGGKEHRTEQSRRSKDELIYLISLEKLKSLWWARNNTALVLATEENLNLISEIPLY